MCSLIWDRISYLFDELPHHPDVGGDEHGALARVVLEHEGAGMGMFLLFLLIFFKEKVFILWCVAALGLVILEHEGTGMGMFLLSLLIFLKAFLLCIASLGFVILEHEGTGMGKNWKCSCVLVVAFDHLKKVF